MGKRFTTVLVSALIMAGAALAETDSKALGVLDSIRRGRNNSDQIDDLRVRDDATIGGDLTVSGTINGAAGGIGAGDIGVTSGSIVVGQSGNVGGVVAMSGDVKIATNGTASIQANAVVSSNITDGTIVNADIGALAAIALSKVTVASGQVVIGQAGNIGEDRAMSGDALIDTNGVVSLQANAVVSSNVTDGTIVNADIGASAAVAGSKLDLTNGTGAITVASPNVVTFGGDFVQHGRVYGTPVTVTVTNTQVLTFNARRSYILDQTNAVQTTNTLANPTVSGTDVVVFNTGTGKVSIARAANFAAPVSPVVLPRYSTMHLYSPNSATWYVVGLETNNSVTP